MRDNSIQHLVGNVKVQLKHEATHSCFPSRPCLFAFSCNVFESLCLISHKDSNHVQKYTSFPTMLRVSQV